MTINRLPTQLYVKINHKYYPVASLEEASQKYAGTVQENYDSGRIPPSRTDPLVVDSDGNIIGHIVHNGRTFRGVPQEQSYMTELLDREAQSDTPDFVETEHGNKFAYNHPARTVNKDPDFPIAQAMRNDSKRIAKYIVKCAPHTRSGITRVPDTLGVLTCPRKMR